MNFSSYFENKTILVTGGTGSIGSEIVVQLIKYNPKAIRIFSNSENELWESKLKLESFSSKLRFLLGDIRNFNRIKRAVEGTDIVFNAAAIKHVPICEYNPMEAINVNIHGLENLIEAAFIYDVEKFIHISTDKSTNPTTVMGATKMLGERLCISRGLAKGTHPTIVSCVRFGNVLGSRGSIIPLILKQIDNGNQLTLTDNKMRRYFMSISQAVELILKSTYLSQGGEIFVLKMPTLIIRDLIEVIIEKYCPIINKDPNSINIRIIGARPGEKLNEELISSIEFSSCYETEDMIIIYPIDYFPFDPVIKEKDKIGEKVVLDKYSTKYATPLSKKEIWNLIKDLNLIN